MDDLGEVGGGRELFEELERGAVGEAGDDTYLEAAVGEVVVAVVELELEVGDRLYGLW